MNMPKISVVIPYKQRLATIAVVFAALAEQTMDRRDFEVVVGALEYSPEYVLLCREFSDRLTITSVLVDEAWNHSRSRNLGIRQASGEVVVLLDADVAMPPHGLQSLYDRYFAEQRDVCVLGQLIGYDNHSDRGDADAEVLPFDRYRPTLAELDEAPDLRRDQRWLFEPVRLPWSVVWTAYVAIRAATIRRHDLYFDQNFRGWGAEDTEWGYRVHASGTPILRGEGLYVLHLPHERDVAAQFRAFDANKGYFLSKWPALEVELFRAFNSWEANLRIEDLRTALAEAARPNGTTLGVVSGTIDGVETIVIGVALNERGEVCDPELRSLLDGGSPTQVLPLLGLALPFPDDSFAQCRVLAPIQWIGEQYRRLVLREADRVARRPVSAPVGSAP